MPDFKLKSFEFRREREAQWHELEDLVRRVEQKGLKNLSGEELRRLPSLYRGALSSLSVARSISLDKNVITYLEGLASRAYFAVYCRKRFLGSTLWTFVSRTFPQLMRQMRWALAVSIAVMTLGIGAGYFLTEQDPDRYFTFVGEGESQDRTPASTKESLEEVLFSGADETGASLSHFAAFLFTHNAKIGLLCFALGFAAGIPVIFLLFINGLSLGAMWALYASHGIGTEFITWVLPHGVTELLAVCVCGAAGLSIGYGLVFPGRYRRLDNLAIRGRQAASITMGAVVMFFFAALLEGFFRQLVHSVDLRILVIALTSIFWVAYLGFSGRQRDERLRYLGDEMDPSALDAVARDLGVSHASPGAPGAGS
ncbi:MAG: putative membrane protein SpoIIM required for sporulation [Myxococcota bacterium]|jgi:uncharacterized membrane protein SpoIIM required for sporulation